MRKALRLIGIILATAFLTALTFALTTAFFHAISRAKYELLVP